MELNDGVRQLDAETKSKLVTGAGFWNTAECPQICMPSVKLSDGPNGMRVQDKRPSNLGMGASKPATCYPTASALACSFDEELIEEVGAHIGREAAAQGVSMLLGPGLNIKRSPLCGRNFEYFSEDTILSGKTAAAFVRGVQSTGVTACVKHFAVNCREHARMYFDGRADEQTLRETYLTGFEIAVKQGKAGAVMTAYNKLNGEYCNQNDYLLNGVLRGEWGFDGVVVSDWGGSHDPVKALKAGADLEMPICRMSAKAITAAVENGELDEAVLDSSVRRILNFSRASEYIARVPYNIEDHEQFARKVAEECLVLLKNESALPLKGDEKVALFGDFAKQPRYQGAGSSQVNPTRLESLLQHFKEYPSFVGFSKGYKRFGGYSRKLVKAAVKLANKADKLIVCIGLDERREAEGSDRTDLKISEVQVELLKALKSTGKKIIAVLTCGSSVETDWDEYADAVILAHLGGQAGAGAVFNALTGKVNPSGRLAETYPLKTGDEACAEVYNSSPYKTDFAEGMYVGYKYYTALNKPVKYPFGYGLSYTEFEYSDFAVEESGVRVKVKNTGEAAGATVVQIYVQAPRTNLVSGFAELKLFKKLYLNAGEQKEVFLAYDEYTLRIWNPTTKSYEIGAKYAISLRENAQTVIAEGMYDTKTPAPDCGAAQTYEEYYNSRITADDCGYKPFKGMTATGDMQVADLKYCKGITAKLFGYIAKRSKKSKDKMKAGMLDYLPVRTLMQFMNLNAVQAEGFLLMCNGRFFKGLGKLLKTK